MDDPRFAETEFLVEATSYEKLCLWSETSDESRHPGKHRWVQDYHGLMIHCGDFGGLPVMVCCEWATIDGCLVCFYDATSMVVHHDMVGDRLKSLAPQATFGDAMNFHNVILRIEELNREAKTVAGHGN